MILNCRYIFSVLKASSDSTKDKTDPKHDPIVDAPNPINTYLVYTFQIQSHLLWPNIALYRLQYLILAIQFFFDKSNHFNETKIKNSIDSYVCYRCLIIHRKSQRSGVLTVALQKI